MLGAVTRRALPKNLIHPLLVQGRMNKGSIPITSAHKRLKLRDYSGSATVRRSKTPSSIECVLAWQICCLYVMSKLISCHDHDLNHFGLVFAKLESQETKLKTAKRGHAPAFQGTIHIGGERVCVWDFFLLLTLDLRM